jgi:steroid delta-isomerase
MTTAAAEKTKSQEARTRAAIEAYVDAWARNDKAALLRVFAPDAVWSDPVGTPPYIGHAGIGGFWDQAHAGGARLEPRVQRIVVCGNEGILLFRMVVRSPNGGGMALDVCDRMVVDENGRITTAQAFWDSSCMVPLDQCD